MKTYAQATPIVKLLDNRFEFDELASAYNNLRYTAVLETVFTVDAKYEANLPGLAFDYYGDVEYWRAIMAFNAMIDPMVEMTVGAQIALPSKTSVDAALIQPTAERSTVSLTI